MPLEHWLIIHLKKNFMKLKKKKKILFFNLSSKLRKSRYGWNSQPNAVKYPSLVKANQFR